MGSPLLTLAAVLSIWSTVLFEFTIGSLAANARQALVQRQANVAVNTTAPLQINSDLSKIPVEPDAGTCRLSTNMTLTGGGFCRPYMIDTISVRSWKATANTTCIRRSAPNTTTPDYCFRNANLDHVPRPQSNIPSPSLIYGTSPYLRVNGTLHKDYSSSFGWFGYEFAGIATAASVVDFSATYEPSFNYLQSGILGFGQYKSKWEELRKDVNARTSYVVESMLTRNISIPLWTLSMPRNDQEKGVVVIGGFAGGSTVPSNPSEKVNILGVPTVQDAHSTDEHGMAYSVKIYGIVHRDDTGKQVADSDMTPETYVIDSLSNIIRTTPEIAKQVANSFEPPASQSTVNEPYYVDCSAKAKKFGVKIAGNQGAATAFFIDQKSMTVKLSENKCISAFQPPAADGIYRLGWPFLMNNIITFNVSTVPATLNITQKAPLA
jgi:hypothetical protein